MEDWKQRTRLLLGEEKMERLQQAHVLVVGLGGVGAYAAEMICRAGVGRMTIVDADTVQPTNINRQLPALHSTSHSQNSPPDSPLNRPPTTASTSNVSVSVTAVPPTAILTLR